MADQFTVLETNILKTKGVTEEDLTALLAAGVASKADFQTVGDAATLRSLLPAMSEQTADAVMLWAIGVTAPNNREPSPQTQAPPVLIESADVVYCIHCKAKQPKDYSSGDLCISCGRQAEPILACFWCAQSGPGKFCRACGAEFVPTGELDLAILLRREGLPKEEVPKRLRTMTPLEKDDLWGRVRRARG